MKIVNFLKKSSDKFVGVYKKSRNKKDHKRALNTTKVYYAVTKDKEYKKIVEELVSLGKGGSASETLTKLLAKNPIGNEYNEYVDEYIHLRIMINNSKIPGMS